MLLLRILFSCIVAPLLYLCPGCYGMGTGPPAFACISMTPMHWKPMTDEYNMDMEFYQTQTEDSKVTITSSPTTYSPGQNITVTIETVSPDTMKGIVLVVNRKTGNTEQPVGKFMDCTPDTKVKYLSYYPQETDAHNCITHKNPQPVSKIQCIFQAPVANEGNLEIAATVVKEKDTYWYRLTKELSSATPRTYPDPIKPIVTFPSIKECSVNKSCLLYPRWCDSVGNCQYMLSYKTNVLDGTVTFELLANGTGWVAMAFSKDEIMHQDFVVGCLESKTKGVATLSTAFTILVKGMHFVGPTADLNSHVTNRMAGIVSDWTGNKKLVCRFDVPFTVLAEFPGFDAGALQYQLAKEDIHIFLGDGITFENTNTMLMHSQRPLISPKLRVASLAAPSTRYFDGMLYRTRIHGTLQIIAWMFCSSIAVVLARHYRPNLSRQLCNGPYKQWFLWHILFIILTMGLAIASFIYILVSIGTWKKMPTIHGSLGCVTLGLGLINIIMGAVGAARCSPKNPRRKVFDWFHWIVGALTRLSAIVTFWLAIRIYGHRDMFDLVGTIVVAIWTGGEVIFFFYFLIKKKLAYWSLKNEFSCPRTKDTIKEEFRTDSYVRHVGPISFLFYFIFIVGVTVALGFAVWVY